MRDEKFENKKKNLNAGTEIQTADFLAQLSALTNAKLAKLDQQGHPFIDY